MIQSPPPTAFLEVGPVLGLTDRAPVIQIRKCPLKLQRLTSIVIVGVKLGHDSVSEPSIERERALIPWLHFQAHRLAPAAHSDEFYFSPTIIELPPGSSCTPICESPTSRIQPMQSDAVYPKPPVVQRSMFSDESKPDVLERRSSSISMS